MLAVVAFVAMACALLLEHSELSRTRASLARYEAQQIPTTLGNDEFRVIANPVLSTDHTIVIAYRIESSEDHFASIVSEGESNGGRARFDEPTALFVTEAVLLIDHSGDSLKVMPKVAGAQGYSLAPVAEGFSLRDAVSVYELEMVHSRRAAVPLFEIEGRTYSVVLKP